MSQGPDNAGENVDNNAQSTNNFTIWYGDEQLKACKKMIDKKFPELPSDIRTGIEKVLGTYFENEHELRKRMFYEWIYAYQHSYCMGVIARNTPVGFEQKDAEDMWSNFIAWLLEKGEYRIGTFERSSLSFHLKQKIIDHFRSKKAKKKALEGSFICKDGTEWESADETLPPGRLSRLGAKVEEIELFVDRTGNERERLLFSLIVDCWGSSPSHFHDDLMDDKGKTIFSRKEIRGAVDSKKHIELKMSRTWNVLKQRIKDQFGRDFLEN